MNNEPISNNAANACFLFRGGGYSDWYLPSIEELLLIYENRLIPNITLKIISNTNPIFDSNTQNSGELSSYNYWSSTQVINDPSTAYCLAYLFSQGATSISMDRSPKSVSITVRAIRKF